MSLENRKDGNEVEMEVLLHAVDLAESVMSEIVGVVEGRRSLKVLDKIVAWARTSHEVFRAAQLYADRDYSPEMADCMYRAYANHVATDSPWFGAMNSRMGAMLLTAARRNPSAAVAIQAMRDKGLFVEPSEQHMQAMTLSKPAGRA